MGKMQKANEHGEAFLKGRRAGVQGTHGHDRKMGAEKTVIGKGDQSDGGTLDSDLSRVASGIYSKAVSNGGGRDSLGDQALHER